MGCSASHRPSGGARLGRGGGLCSLNRWSPQGRGGRRRAGAASLVLAGPMLYSPTMTLILSTLTLDYVVQVSDRRLTGIRKELDGTVSVSTPLPVEATKAVVFEYHTSFGYTGLAQLPRSKRVKAGPPGELVDSNRWLADVLVLGNSLQESVEILLEETTVAIEALLKQHPPELCAIAFIGAGWSAEDPGSPLRPIIHEITNMNRSVVQRREVNRIAGVMPEGQQWFTHSSRDLTHEVFSLQDRKISKCVRNGARPGAIARVLRETLRRFADWDRSVGKSVLQTCLPRKAVESVLAGEDYYVTGNYHDLDNLTCRRIPADETEGIGYVPTIVLPSKEIFDCGIILEGLDSKVRICTKPASPLGSST